MSSKETDVQLSSWWLLLRNVLGMANTTQRTDFHAFFCDPKCAFLNFIRDQMGKERFFLSACNLLLHLPSEHIINLGE